MYRRMTSGRPAYRLGGIALAGGLAVAGLGPTVPAAASPATAPATPRAAQTLTWTAGDPIDHYLSAPAEAAAGATTIVFENSAATGNTTGMPHTLTFDTSTPGYNSDVNLNILANPFDADNGRHLSLIHI